MLNKSSYYRHGVSAQALSGTTAAKGSGIDRLAAANEMAENINVICFTGATANTPTSFGVTYKLQHSDDDVDGNYTDVDNFDADNLSSVAITAANTTAAFAVDARGLKRYIRVVETPAFVGGSSPTVIAGAVIEFSGCKNEPVS